MKKKTWNLEENLFEYFLTFYDSGSGKQNKIPHDCLKHLALQSKLLLADTLRNDKNWFWEKFRMPHKRPLAM